MSQSGMRLGITMGDPSGIGPELVIKALFLWQRTRQSDAAIDVENETTHWLRDELIVFGDWQVLSAAASLLSCDLSSLAMRVTEEDLRQQQSPASNEQDTSIQRPCVIDLSQQATGPFPPAEVSPKSGRASFVYFRSAIEAALADRIDAIVTCPLNKESLHAGGIEFPGHTEILERYTAAKEVGMMLTSRQITCSLVTTHVPLSQVPELLTIDKIVRQIRLTHEAMSAIRNRPAPRLLVLGLNPHAGERGLFGDEETRVIQPAVARARELGFNVVGPLPPDTAFLPKYRQQTDAYICMYHDQGLIPLKALAFDEAVNVTLGLSIVRTSVDHGTAFDIAWQGVADPSSLYEAIELASRLARHRQQLNADGPS